MQKSTVFLFYQLWDIINFERVVCVWIFIDYFKVSKTFLKLTDKNININETGCFINATTRLFGLWFSGKSSLSYQIKNTAIDSG